MYLEQFKVESMLLKHYFLAGSVANCPLRFFLYAKKHLGNDLLSVIQSSRMSTLDRRGYECMVLIGKTIGTQRFVHYIGVSL